MEITPSHQERVDSSALLLAQTLAFQLNCVVVRFPPSYDVESRVCYVTEYTVTSAISNLHTIFSR